MFCKKPSEVKQILEICKQYNLKISGSMFVMKSKSILESIDYVKDNYGIEYVTDLIISKRVSYLKTVLPYLKSEGLLPYVINSSSILSLRLEEIIERKEYIESIGEDLIVNGRFNIIFGKTRRNYEKLKNNQKQLKMSTE